jgi:raffinose/stachyose/melibiose transport system substrate-binding protein
MLFMKKIAVLMLTALCVVSSIFATGQKEAETTTKSGEIVISYPTYLVGSHLGAKTETKLIKEFNEDNAGVYQVEVEELPSDQSYLEKMKVLASADSLPDVVEGKNGILELAIKTGRAVDLTPYLEADPQFAAEIGSAAINANTVDGKVYTISNGNSLIGYFYNKKHFEDAGITPAKTWPEFMSNLEALKQAGHTPISMMTGENCWTTNLLLASYIGTSEDGEKFMNTKYPTDYNTQRVQEGLEMIQTILQNYTSKDAIGAKYDIAANHFLQGSTSIICNGPWMVGDFSNEAKASKDIMNNIGVALYPNDGMFAEFSIGYMVCAEDKAQQDAAMEFVKKITNAQAQLERLEEGNVLPLTGNVKMSDEFKASNTLISYLVELSGQAKYNYLTLDINSYSSVIDVMASDYPALASGDITVDEMIQDMNAAAARSK